MNINSPKKVKILILASGNGSNGENIVNYFRKKNYNIDWNIITNNRNAGIIERSRNQQETTTFLSAYNRLKPTLLERRLSETKSPTLYINSLVLCLVAFAIGGSREEHLL